mgnify:CR=1 FL=1
MMIKSFALSLLFLFVGTTVFGQNGVIKGTIKDDEGKPVFNASVVIEGKSRGAFSNDKGYYEISLLEAGSYTLVFKNVGYKNITKQASLTNGQILVLDVNFGSAEKELDEVVVIGYGTTRTKDLTGSAAVINEKNFVQGSVSTPEQLIQGKVAGVKINTNDGAPGGGSTIRLRGGTSINASNDPLIVVDGVPLDNGGIAGASNPLSLINPNDIASFVVLKDASATAIYGSRGANGVILITTKKGDGGSSDKLKVVFDTKNSLSTIAKYADVLNGDEYRALVNAKGTTAQKALLGTANTDWQKEVFRAALITDNNVSIMGGIKKLPYRLSFGNRYENGILLTDNFNRTSVSLNLTPTFLKNHLALEINNRYVHTNSTFANRGALGAAFFDPTQSVYSGNSSYDGYFEWIKNGKPNVLAARNPLGLINSRSDLSSVNRYIGNAKISYKLPFFPQMKAVLNLGIDQSEGTGTVTTKASSASGYYTRGSYNEYRQSKGNKLIEAYLNYNNADKKSKHLVDLTAGYSFQNWETSSPNNATYNEARDSIIAVAAQNPFYTANALLSYYGRGIYTYNDKYVVNATLRYDGSSRFSENTRWGLFPSVSAAWIISKEGFMKNITWLNLLKLRAGYGVTGQQDGIGDYSYIGNFFEGSANAQYAFGGQFYTVYRPNGYDANLKWEQTASINVGLDFGIKKDRLSGSVDFYQKTTTDLLATVPVPVGTNFTNAILTNVGSMRNTGVEVSLNYGLIARKDLRIDLLTNVSYNKNEVLKLAQVVDPKSPGILVGGISGIGNTVQVHQLGNPTFSYFVYEQVYNTDGTIRQEGQQASVDINGDNQITTADKWRAIDTYVDRNKDGVINIDDRYITEKAAPNVFVGLSMNVTYKNWFGGFSMRGEFGGYIYNNIHSANGTFQSINGTTGSLNNLSSSYYDDEILKSNERQLLSDHYLEKADFFRMDNINIGYKFGKLKFTKNRVGLNAAFSVNNVFVITQYSGQDPEVSNGIDNNIYPRPRVYSLNLTFDF